MSGEAPAIAWPRSQWTRTDQDAVALWFVFGDFDSELPIDGTRYRTRGVPPGIEFARYRNADLSEWSGYPLDGALGRLLREEEPARVGAAAEARECLMLRGTLEDPPNLDWLRDAVGLVSALVDLGGVAVVDPQILSILDRETWMRTFFARETFSARDHVLILCNEDDRHEGRLHVHTRGMRKFARPDISVRAVPSAHAGIAGQLAERFVDYEADGGVVPEGLEVEIGEGHALRAHRGGSLEDPSFNNIHVEFVWPA